MNLGLPVSGSRPQGPHGRAQRATRVPAHEAGRDRYVLSTYQAISTILNVQQPSHRLRALALWPRVPPPLAEGLVRLAGHERLSSLHPTAQSSVSRLSVLRRFRPPEGHGPERILRPPRRDSPTFTPVTKVSFTQIIFRVADAVARTRGQIFVV